MKHKTSFLGFGAILLTGCAYLPTAPSVMALPGTGMSFNQFRQDDYLCRRYAYGQTGGTSANQAAIDSQVGSMIVGSALGAATGAVLGGGEGAAIGAGIGLLAGSLEGGSESTRSAYVNQQLYDNAYVQCMYAKGHRVPVPGQFSYENQRAPVSPTINIPPPPPGSPPPPPYK